MKLRTRRPVVNARKPRRVSPLKADPSRTASLRRQWVAELRARFRRLRKRIVWLIVERDALGLVPRMGPFTANEDWRFRSDPEKVRSFEAWLRQQMSAELLGLSEQQVWERFIRAGLEKGAARAFDDTRASERAAAVGQEKLDFYAGTRDEFLRSAFTQPVAVEKVKLLAGRSFGELKGVTEQMATQMTRALVDGLVQGQGPREIARELDDKIGIGLKRAERIAQHELIAAHAEGQLDAFDKMGIEEVGAALEWSTAGDARVCPRCKAMDGVVLKVSEARGKIPAHVGCRCAWLPAQAGEDDAGQKKTKPAIDAAAAKAGVDLDVSAARPQSILDARAELKR